MIKTEKRKLAELVARQRGIKVKSAQSWLNRIAAGKVKKPKYDLTSYAKKKVRKFVRSEKAKREKPKAEKVPTIPTRPRRANYPSSARETLAVRATYNFYGSDNRTRTIRFHLTGSELNKFLNATTPNEALDRLKTFGAGKFLGDADIYGLDHFMISGGEQHGDEYFD